VTDVGLYRAYGPERKLNAEKMALISAAADIVREYEASGLALTLRQLHYQFVSRNLYPNSKASYDRLQDVVSDGRLAGLISWTGLEDRTRNLKGRHHVSGIGQALAQLKLDYHLDLWANQPMRVEIWIEKEALAGVIEPIAYEESVDFFACRGYTSQSEQWRAGRRFADYVSRGQRPVVIYMGDHDPSGLDMVEDHRRRLAMFAGVPVHVHHLALTMEQIHRHSPPPNYAKKADARYEKYRAQWGEHSWELDALPPDVLQRLVRETVQRYRDEALWSAMTAELAEDVRTLEEMIADE
jgi:hypothetical protein